MADDKNVQIGDIFKNVRGKLQEAIRLGQLQSEAEQAAAQFATGDTTTASPGSNIPMYENPGRRFKHEEPGNETFGSSLYSGFSSAITALPRAVGGAFGQMQAGFQNSRSNWLGRPLSEDGATNLLNPSIMGQPGSAAQSSTTQTEEASVSKDIHHISETLDDMLQMMRESKDRASGGVAGAMSGGQGAAGGAEGGAGAGGMLANLIGDALKSALAFMAVPFILGGALGHMMGPLGSHFANEAAQSAANDIDDMPRRAAKRMANSKAAHKNAMEQEAWDLRDGAYGKPGSKRYQNAEAAFYQKYGRRQAQQVFNAIDQGDTTLSHFERAQVHSMNIATKSRSPFNFVANARLGGNSRLAKAHAALFGQHDVDAAEKASRARGLAFNKSMQAARKGNTFAMDDALNGSFLQRPFGFAGKAVRSVGTGAITLGGALSAYDEGFAALSDARRGDISGAAIHAGKGAAGAAISASAVTKSLAQSRAYQYSKAAASMAKKGRGAQAAADATRVATKAAGAAEFLGKRFIPGVGNAYLGFETAQDFHDAWGEKDLGKKWGHIGWGSARALAQAPGLALAGLSTPLDAIGIGFLGQMGGLELADIMGSGVDGAHWLADHRAKINKVMSSARLGDFNNSATAMNYGVYNPPAVTPDMKALHPGEKGHQTNTLHNNVNITNNITVSNADDAKRIAHGGQQKTQETLLQKIEDWWHHTTSSDNGR